MSSRKLDLRTSRKSVPVSTPLDAQINSRPSRSAKKHLPSDEISSEQLSRKKTELVQRPTRKADLPSTKKAAKRPPKSFDAPTPTGHLEESGLRPRRSDAASYLAKKFLENSEQEQRVKKPKVRRSQNGGASSNAYLPQRYDTAYVRRPKRGRRPKYITEIAPETVPYYGHIGWEEKDVDTYDDIPAGGYHEGADPYPPIYDNYPPDVEIDPAQHSDFFLKERKHSRRQYAPMESYLAGEEEPNMMGEDYFEENRRSRQQELYMESQNDSLPTHRRKSPVRPIRNTTSMPDPYDMAMPEDKMQMQFEAATALAQVHEVIQQQQMAAEDEIIQEPSYQDEDYVEYERQMEPPIFDDHYYEAFSGPGNMLQHRGSGDSQDFSAIRRQRRRPPVSRSVGLPRKAPPTILKRLSSANNSENGNTNNLNNLSSSNNNNNVIIRPPPFSTMNNKVVFNQGPKLVGVSSQVEEKREQQQQKPGPSVVKVLSAPARPQQTIMLKSSSMENGGNEGAEEKTTITHENGDQQPPPAPVFIAATSVNGTRTLIPATVLSRPPRTVQPPAPPPEPTASELLFGKRLTPQPATQISYLPTVATSKYPVASPFGLNLIANSAGNQKRVLFLPNGVNSAESTAASP